MVSLSDYEHLLIPALKHSNGATMDLVRADIAAGEAMFWPGERSAAVTHEYKASECVIWLAGGDMRELFEMEKAAVEFAKSRGCSRMVVEDGRHGWGRALTRIGYRATRSMVKDI